MPKPRKPKQKTVTTDDGRVFPLYERKLTGKDIPCFGDAHKPEVANNIDNCMVCMPRWGVVAEREPELTADQVEAELAKGFAVARYDAVYKQTKDMADEWVTLKSKGGQSSFCAILPKVKP